MSDRPLLRRHVAWPRVARQDLWAGAAFLLVALFFFRGAVLERGVLFRRDISLVWYPQVESFVRCAKMGSWPLWDPYRGFGQPLLADPSAEVLYPFTWLNLIAPPWTVYLCFVVAHLTFSGLGLYTLAQRLGVSRAGAFTAALAWIASGPFLSLASTWHHMAGAAWIPWVFLAVEAALDGPSVRRTLLAGGAIAAQILAGSADMVAMTLVALAVHAAIHRVEWTRPTGSRNRSLVACLTLAMVVALGLSAAQWIPTLEMARGSARLGVIPQMAQVRTQWSLHPMALIEAVMPVHWNDLPLSPPWIANILDSAEPWLHSIYFGIPLLALAAAGATGLGAARRVGFTLLAGGATLVALGRHFPAYAIAVWVLPPLQILRFPMKAMVITAFALAVLAGFGFDNWRLAPAQHVRWRFGVVGAAALLTLATAAALVLSTRGLSWWAPSLLTKGPGIPSYADALASTVRQLLLATCLGSATLFLCWRRGLSAPIRAAIVAIALLVDLGSFHRNLHPVAPKAIFTHRPEVLTSLGPLEDRRVYVYDYSRATGRPNPFRIDAVPPPGWTHLQLLTFASLLYMTPPTSGRWGVLGSYDLDLLGLQPRSLAELNAFLRQQEGTPVHTRLLQMASVSNVVDLAPPSEWPGLSLRAVVPGLFSEPTRVYRVPQPLPRTYVVGKVVAADGPGALRAISAPEFDPREEVVLPERPPGPGSDTSGARARVIESRPDHVVVSADLPAPGYLVLVDGYSPGWHASVDGRPARLLRANIAFRAVAVPEGIHEVIFHYRPASVLLGLAISATALFGAVGFGLNARAAP